MRGIGIKIRLFNAGEKPKIYPKGLKYNRKNIWKISVLRRKTFRRLKNVLEKRKKPIYNFYNYNSSIKNPFQLKIQIPKLILPWIPILPVLLIYMYYNFRN